MRRAQTSFLFDLDGTLVVSVYQHVLAWREALKQEGIALSVWSIHRKIGMSGGLFTNMLLRETGLNSIPNGSNGCGDSMPMPTMSGRPTFNPFRARERSWLT